MVKINKIYTKTGDKGETGLVGGKRIAKDSIRVSAYGDVDELNSYLGVIRTIADKANSKTLSEIVAKIQNDLFDMGSLLATPSGETWEGMPKISDSHIKWLEDMIDAAVQGIPELRSFVLPGGTELNAHLHVARTVCRRAERTVLALKRSEAMVDEIGTYLNRLSDLLFALARKESHDASVPEYLWKPGG